MAIYIRSADLDTDRDALIDLFFRCLTPLSDARRFEWLYRSGPHGSAQVWVAIDARSGVMVGAVAAFPRRLYVEGEQKVGCVLGDFCILAGYRSLGAALRLQQACMEAVVSRSFHLCFDFPSHNMMAVYRRMGIKPTLQLVRLARPLRADRSVGRVVKLRPLARTLSSVANLWLARKNTLRSEAEGCLLVPQVAPCGDEFTALAQRIGGRYGVCTQRSAQYLNWRYFAHPFVRYEMLTARRDGALLGYVVFTQNCQDAGIADVFSIDEAAVISSLVTGVVARFRESQVATVSLPALQSHPWFSLFRALGFRPRETSPVVTYFPSEGATGLQHTLAPGQNWFLMQGDRDS